MTSIYGNAFDEQPGKAAHDGFRSRRRFLGRRAGAERLGLSLWEVPPGECAWEMSRRADTVDYWTGESPPES